MKLRLPSPNIVDEIERVSGEQHYGLNYLKVPRGNVMFDITKPPDVREPDVGQ